MPPQTSPVPQCRDGHQRKGDYRDGNHQHPVRYQLSPPPEPRDVIDAKSIYIHPANGHRNHVLDEATQLFVNETRIKA